MSLSFLIHSLFLILGVWLTFIWVNHPQLSLYTLQLVALFVLLYFLSNWVQRKNIRGAISYPPTRWVNSIILTMVVLLLVFSTGGLTSPLFFLIYFLLFGLSLTLEPGITVILSFCLIIFFFISSYQSYIDNLITLFSLLLITPLSLFFGRQYLKVLNQKGEIKILSSKYFKSKKDLSQEETNILLWLSLNFKYGMIKIIDLVTQVLEKPGFSLTQKENLKNALNQAKQLLKTGKILEEKIDSQTDD